MSERGDEEDRSGDGERYRSARSLRARAIAEDLLDDILARGPKLPEPLAALLLEVEVARDENDNTGVRKRLYELAVGVVRYGFSIGLAALRASLPNASAPAPIADAIRRSFKLTDGRWLELVRLFEGALRRSAPSVAKALKFASSPVLNAMVQSRNAFIHAGATGDDAGERAREVLDCAADLLAFPLRVVASNQQLELRQGVPKRRGVWRKTEITDASLASQVILGQAYLLLSDSQQSEALPMDPWLPHVEGTLRLVDSPHAPGRRWRCICPETGEHLENAAFDAALRAFVGEDGSAPRPPVDRPQIVGRDGQISLVTRALKEAAAGRIRMVLVSGPQGSGLTRKLAEAASGGVGFGFQSTIEAFASSDRRTPFSSLRLALSGSNDPALAELRDALEGLVSSGRVSDRARFDVELESLEERIVAFSRKRPLLITIDDAQWLDEQTLALLRLLVDRASRGAVGSLAVVVAAHDESSPTPGLAQLMVDIDKEVGSGATRVALPPLDEPSSRKLVQAVAPFDQDVEATVVSGASGLPFYLVQPLLVWVETGALEWRNGVWTRAEASLEGVPGIAELTLGRIASYFETGSDAERAAHYVLALVSGDTTATPLERVFSVLEKLEEDSALTSRVIETLLGAGILVRRQAQTVAIPQPIVARALAAKYHQRAWWIRFARIVLGVLEEEPAHLRDAETIARGFDSLGDQERALPWYRDAIVQRLRQGAFEQARILAEHLATRETNDKLRLAAELHVIDAMARNGAVAAALTRHQQMLVPANRRLELEWRIAGEMIAAGAGRPTEQDLERLVADADKLGDRTQQVNARLVFARRRRGRQGREAIQAALERLDDDDAETNAPLEVSSDIRYRLLALDLELAYETREGGVEALRQAAARARAAARQIGSTWAELDVANDAAILEADTGDLDQAVAQLVEVAVKAGQAHFGSVRRVALTNAAALLLRVPRGGDALAYSMTAETESRVAGDSRSLALALSLRSEAELLRDEVKAALDAIAESIAIRERAGDKSLGVALLRRADAKERLGDLAEARQDGLLALEKAEAASNIDHAALAKLWVGLFDVRHEPQSPKALNALADILGALTAIAPKLRAPTLKKRDEAVQILRSRGIEIHA